MDEVAILGEISRRNALRQEHGLPLLDIETEYARLVLIERQRGYRIACEEHADEYDAIRRQMLEEHSPRCRHHVRAMGHRLQSTCAVHHLHGRAIRCPPTRTIRLIRANQLDHSAHYPVRVVSRCSSL